MQISTITKECGLFIGVSLLNKAQNLCGARLIELTFGAPVRVQNGSLDMASAWAIVCLALLLPGPESTRHYSHHAR